MIVMTPLTKTKNSNGKWQFGLWFFKLVLTIVEADNVGNGNGAAHPEAF